MEFMEQHERGSDGETRPVAPDAAPAPEPAPDALDGLPAPDALDEAMVALSGHMSAPHARDTLAHVISVLDRAFGETRSVEHSLSATEAGTVAEGLAVLAGLEQARSSLGAARAMWMAETEGRIRRADASRDVRPQDRGRSSAGQIALAQRSSPRRAAVSLSGARTLVEAMPRTLEALAAGDITEEQAYTVTRTLDGAAPATCESVDQEISNHPNILVGKGSRQVRDTVTVIAQDKAAGFTRDRAERAARARHVRMEPLADGMARLTAILRATDAVSVMKKLGTDAKALKNDGSGAPKGALEADILVDSIVNHTGISDHTSRFDRDVADADLPVGDLSDGDLPAGDLSDVDVIDAPASGERVEIGATSSDATPSDTALTDGISSDGEASTGRPDRRRIEVGIVITDHALLSDEESGSAILEGYGRIPAHVVVDTLAGHPPGSTPDDPSHEYFHPDDESTAFFRRLYSHPESGELIAMESRSRIFPIGIRRMIDWTRTTCDTPWCNGVPVQVDHARSHASGGETSYANAQNLCLMCNLMKEYGPWNVRVETDDRGATLISWTSPDGATGSATVPPVDPPEPSLGTLKT